MAERYAPDDRRSGFAPILDPGTLWHLVSIVARELVDLPNGGQEVTDVPIVTDEPAELSPLDATERAQAGGILATATHRICLYWVAGIKPAQFVTYADPFEGRTRTFEILSVVNVNERAWTLELLAIEKV